MGILVMSWKGIADLAAGASVTAAFVGEAPLAIAASVVAVGSIVVPRILDWFKQMREVARQEHIRDVQSDSQLLQSEVVRRLQTEAVLRDNQQRIKDLEAKLASFSCPHADGQGARCHIGEPPGAWLKTETENEHSK